MAKEKPASKGHSLSTEHRRRDNANKSKQVRSTYQLSTTDEGTNQDSERKWASKVYSPTAAHRRRNKSVHKRKVSEMGHSPTIEPKG
jgi:hypothetical protein